MPTDPTSGELTIEHVNIGEPFISCTDKSLMFLMKVQTLDPQGTGQAILPENSGWQILFNITDDSGNPETVYVELDTFSPNTPVIPRVSLGRRDPTATGTLDTRVCSNGATTTCPGLSVTYAVDGTIEIKLDVSTVLDFPVPGTPATGSAFTWNAGKIGSVLSKVVGNTYLLAGAGAGFLETVQTTGANGSYTVAGNMNCVHQPPVAQLFATPKSGDVPLAVSFDGSGSTDPLACATINSYTLDFGDGSNALTQATPTFTHTYNRAGSYWAVLIVGDTAGQTSDNLARQVIVANPTPTPTPTPTPSPTPTPTATPTPTPKPHGKPTPTPTPTASPTPTPTATPSATPTPTPKPHKK